MKSVAERDTNSFQILYDRYHLYIFNYILRYTGSREIAEDLLQETFTRIWFAAHTFDQKRGNFKAWLFKIALNITRNEMSKKRYDYFYCDISDINDSHEELYHSEKILPDKQLENTELRDEIFKILGKLKPNLREIVILKHYQQLKFREIAQITGTPEGTLKARFHRAIAQLKLHLKNVEI